MKQCNLTTLIYIVCLLFARSNAAPATSSPEPESPVFTLDLESGNAPAALQTLRQSDPPAVAAGAEAYNSSLLGEVIFQAAYNLLGNPAGAGASVSSRTFDKSAYEKAFGQFFSQLKTTNQSEASQAFADAMAEYMQGELENSGMFPLASILSPMVVLAHAADLDQSYAQAFHQFKSHPPTGGFGDNAVVNFDIQDAATVIRELLDNEYVTIEPSVSSAFRDGAISAYGATPENLLQAKGNSSALGTFLYGSAYLTNTSTPAVVQNLTATIASIQLPQADTSEAFYQAILQSLQQPAGIASPDATATLVAAAVGAGAGPEVGRAFLQATSAPLQLLCNTQIAAQSLNAGQAVNSAIPSVFGPEPCSTFQVGDGDVFLHATNENTAAAQASCSTQYTDTPLKADCSKAVMELQANSSAVCRVPNTTVETSDTTDYISNEYRGNKNVALATSGQCQVILGGTVGTSLPCASVSYYANKLNTACGTSNGSTGGIYYPAGVVYYPGSVEPMQDQPPSVYVALSQIIGQ